MSRPPEPGSKPSRPGLRGVNWNRPLGRHHVPISPVKAANARSGVAATRMATSTRDASQGLSRCALNAASSSDHSCSVSSNQARSSAIGAGLSR